VQIADWKALYEQAVAALKRADEVHDSQIADWKRLYDQASDGLKATRSQLIEMAEEKNRKIASPEERVALNDAELTRSNASVGRLAADEKPIGTKERESLLKLVIGMARDSYNFDPKLSRSAVPQEIANDLAKYGISLDVDTVRKWLKQAAEFLPGK
jgi:hypothetical protein